MMSTLGSLTAKELEALSGVADLKSAKQIAAELGVSPKAIEDRLERVRGKLGVQTSAEAARLYRAQALGAFPPENSGLGSTPTGDLGVGPGHSDTSMYELRDVAVDPADRGYRYAKQGALRALWRELVSGARPEDLGFYPRIALILGSVLVLGLGLMAMSAVTAVGYRLLIAVRDVTP